MSLLRLFLARTAVLTAWHNVLSYHVLDLSSVGLTTSALCPQQQVGSGLSFPSTVLSSLEMSFSHAGIDVHWTILWLHPPHHKMKSFLPVAPLLVFEQTPGVSSQC